MQGPTAMKAVITLEDARAIRAAVLEGSSEVERDAGVVGGVEYACWRVTGNGWRARVTNKYDLQRGMTTQPMRQTIPVDDATSYERLELFVDRVDPDMPVLEMEYRIEGGEEKLVRYRGGRWEQLFEIGTFRRLPVDAAKSVWLKVLSAA